jgi:hypothetical integral membrane protein (TIGR02206 family)
VPQSRHCGTADDEQVVTPEAYWLSVAVAGALCAALCLGARRRAGSWTRWVRYALALLLTAIAATFVVTPLVDGTWTAHYSLPVDLCDAAVLVAAFACVRPGAQVAVELTWFWGLAGTVQAIITPDLDVGFPHLAFWEFVLGHLGIVLAALFLVVGLRVAPRRGAVVRVFAITVGYTALVAVVDSLTGGNYMFLRTVPAHASLLSLLGPWPWYIVSAAGVALALFLLLDAPFRHRRTR